MTRRWKVTSAVAALVLIQASAWLVYRWAEDRRAGAFQFERLEPTPAPALDLEQADGRRATLRTFAPRFRLVHFWATWCAPCRTELPEVLELAADPEFRDRLAVLAVSVDDGWDPVARDYAGLPKAIWRADRAAVREEWTTSSFPETWLVDPQGRLRARMTGPRAWGTSAARRGLAALLKE